MNHTRAAFFVSIREAAHALGVSKAHLYRLIKAGKIPFYKLSSRVLRVDLAELRGFMRLIAEGNHRVEGKR